MYHGTNDHPWKEKRRYRRRDRSNEVSLAIPPPILAQSGQKISRESGIYSLLSLSLLFVSERVCLAQVQLSVAGIISL